MVSEQPVPFFFEKNAKKEYSEKFRIKVGRKGKRTLVGQSDECFLADAVAGRQRLIEVSSDGWQITSKCSGKWNPPKLGMNDDDEMEL